MIRQTRIVDVKLFVVKYNCIVQSYKIVLMLKTNTLYKLTLPEE